MKEFSRISTFSTLGALSLKYPNLPMMDEVYQNYLKLTVDEKTSAVYCIINYF